MTGTADMERTSSPPLSGRGEQVLWMLIGVAAVVLRVVALGSAPLAAGEAREATLAWRAVTGQGMPVASYSPVLLAANSLLFTLFGSSDGLARFVPAVMGACLALTPVLLRRHLGHVGALAAGICLAISPTALAASRQLDGTVIAVTGAIAFLGGWLRFLETDSPGWLTFAAIGLGLGVTSGPALYGLLLPAVLAYAVLSQLPLRTPDLITAHAASKAIAYLPRFFVTFVVSVLVFATGLGWNLSGISASGGLLAGWLARFSPGIQPTASPMALLVVYEFGVAVFGTCGLIWGLQQRNRLSLVLGLWAVLALSLLMLMPGRVPTDLLWAVLPLSMLAGFFIEWLARYHLSPDRRLRVVHFAIVLVLWAYGYLMLARYAFFGDRADLVLVLITVVLQVSVGLGFGLILGGPVTLRTTAAGTTVALLALTLRAGWGVAYRHLADPREIMFTEPTCVGVRDLVQTLEDISWHETGLPLTLRFAYEAPEDSVLAWYLRGFTLARRADELRDLSTAEMGAVVVTYGREGPVTAAAGNEFIGQDFPLQGQWGLEDLGCRFWRPDCGVAVSWFFFRDAGPLPETQRWATVWRVVGSGQGD